ncbi:MAG: hypothetical protein LBJ13_00030 [Puniceicoccales bacterium]|nr:hypothetical protein [Puniceicoccales bacterium]
MVRLKSFTNNVNIKKNTLDSAGKPSEAERQGWEQAVRQKAVTQDWFLICFSVSIFLLELSPLLAAVRTTPDTFSRK